MLINILRELTCRHDSTATHVQAFTEPHPHVTVRTRCLECGKAVSPRERVPDAEIHALLMEAARNAGNA